MSEAIERRIDQLLQRYSVLYQAGQFEHALPVARELCDCLKLLVGERHPSYAVGLTYLARLHHSKGNYGEALSPYRQALEITRATLGEVHPNFAGALNNLAELYREMGDHAAALPLYRQALAVTRAAFGEQHPDFATCLNNLAMLLQDMGDYAAALPHFCQAMKVTLAALGENHPDSATSLNNLAGLYQAMGNHAAALPLFQQAITVRSAALGENHPLFAQSLNNLALLHRQMGDHAVALPLYRQALKVTRAALGEAHPEFAASLNNLAGLYQVMGEHGSALPLARQALDVTRAALGEAHPEFARSLNNLARLYQVMGDHAAALPLLRQALEVSRAALGEQHPAFATSLGNLAGLYGAMGDHAAALALARQALEIRRTALGEDHPEFATGLNNLAALYVAMDCPSEALTLMERAAAVEDRLIGQIFSIGSDRQRLSFLATVHGNREALLSLAWRHLASSPQSITAALNLLLRRKAIAAESLAVQHQAVLGDKYPAQRDRFQEWAALRGQIARATLAGPGPEGPGMHKERLNQWRGQQERLEADLARQVPEMNLEQRLRSVDSRAVAEALPPGAALVEFVRFLVFDFQAVLARSEQQWQSPRYLAFVLCAGAADRVRMIDLGEAEPIDRLVADFRAGVTGGAEVRDLAKESRPPGVDAGASPGESLRATVFDPLDDALGACRRLFLAPDGDLSRLPFEALPLADGRHLLDSYRISYVSVGRDLLRFQVRSDRPPAGPLVAADPDFDLGVKPDLAGTGRGGADSPAPRKGLWGRLFGRDRLAPARQPAPKAVVPSPAAPTGRLSRDLDRSQCHFVRLPGTRAEGERVARQLRVPPLLDGAALESRLKACRSPCILHLATHGFFLPDQPRDPNQFRRNLELMGVGETPGLGRLSGPGMEDPMLRSGLALAGANTFLKGGAPPPEAEDGLLTAEDVAGLDLLDTELVVLSACETGLGAVHIGEGVFGLRRAFIVAGARTLVMSLWKVPDLATAFLMDRFYENLLTRGLDRDLALSAAQRSTRDATVAELKGEWLTPAMIEQFAAGDANTRRHLEQLAQQPDEHRPFTQPFCWGAFICQGDPSPLPAMAQERRMTTQPPTGGNH
jgi:tetratricopeptide (TPR) repeat protein